MPQVKVPLQAKILSALLWDREMKVGHTKKTLSSAKDNITMPLCSLTLCRGKSVGIRGEPDYRELGWHCETHCEIGTEAPRWKLSQKWEIELTRQVSF